MVFILILYIYIYIETIYSIMVMLQPGGQSTNSDPKVAGTATPATPATNPGTPAPATATPMTPATSAAPMSPLPPPLAVLNAIQFFSCKQVELSR